MFNESCMRKRNSFSKGNRIRYYDFLCSVCLFLCFCDFHLTNYVSKLCFNQFSRHLKEALANVECISFYLPWRPSRFLWFSATANWFFNRPIDHLAPSVDKPKMPQLNFSISSHIQQLQIACAHHDIYMLWPLLWRTRFLSQKVINFVSFEVYSEQLVYVLAENVCYFWCNRSNHHLFTLIIKMMSAFSFFLSQTF